VANANLGGKSVTFRNQLNKTQLNYWHTHRPSVLSVAGWSKVVGSGSSLV